MRVLGVDFGGKRIGLAVGDSEHGIPAPRPAIEATGTLAKDADNLIAKLLEEQGEAIVLGIPIGEQGENEKMGRIVRMLRDRIVEKGARVELVDEAFTSIQAENSLREQDWTAATRRKHRDSEAACLILERFFEGQTS